MVSNTWPTVRLYAANAVLQALTSHLAHARGGLLAARSVGRLDSRSGSMFRGDGARRHDHHVRAGFHPAFDGF